MGALQRYARIEGISVCLMLAMAAWEQVRKEPKEVVDQRRAEAAAANAAQRKEQQEQNDSKKRMKGKNKPSRRQRKKQDNVIEERRGDVKARMREQGVLSGGGAEKKAPVEIPEGVPRALHRFYRKGAGA